MSDVGVNRDGGLSAAQLGRGSCTHSAATGRFCGDCGARLSPRTHAAEYKQVTVLFADVVQSMHLAAVLDMERLREIVTDLVERSAAVARRFGGGTVEYTGDGLMVLFGAPFALEDHAFRACLAALAIQDEVKVLAADVQRRDGVVLQVRVGLHSGRVIAGEVTSASSRYAATGETVGFAHRMQSVARPGGVLLSDTTARLVEHRATLSEALRVHIKGADEPVRAYHLTAIHRRGVTVARSEAGLVGRADEMAALEAVLDEAISEHGRVMNVVGSAGIGKSRLAREAASLAVDRGMDVFWGFCESHARDVPFHAVSTLLRAGFGIGDLDRPMARAAVRRQFLDADPQDLVLLHDLLEIADSNVVIPTSDSDVRRRRLTELISTWTLTRSTPTLILVEDAHWMDAVSESVMTDFLAVISRTSSAVLITSRPEYSGPLLDLSGARTIALGPLDDPAVDALLGELLGSNQSIGRLAAVIAQRAAGNPFFIEEIVRELVQRGVLAGERGEYACDADVSDVSVPVTVAAAIDARIDRLSPSAERTLTAASVIGVRFEADLVSALGIDPVFDELVSAELLDRVPTTSRAEYSFRHPLIRAVAYESQLKADRAEWHRRLSAAIQQRAGDSVEEKAALIAEHLHAAGDLHAAHGWHMRAGAWSTNRDLTAARVSWERARRIADALSDDDPEALSMRIAPRTMLCATDLQAREVQDSKARFTELRALCNAAGDKVSLAIGMSAVATEAMYSGRAHEAAQLSSQQVALLESIDDPTPTMGLAAVAFCSWLGVLEFREILRWSQTVVDLAAGDPTRGAGYGVGSPLAIALAWRGTSRSCLGHHEWCQDLHDAVAMARESNAETLSGVIAWSYGIAMQYGMLRADGSLLGACEHALRTAHQASNNRATGLAGYTLAVWLLQQNAEADRDRGLELMAQTREIWSRRGIQFLLPVTDIWATREVARRGDYDTSLPAMRRAVAALRQKYPFYAVWATAVLAETLAERHGDSDIAEIHEAVSWLTTIASEHDSAMIEITWLRLRALLARTEGDVAAYRDAASRYRACAVSLGFEGHMSWAEELTDAGK